MIAAVARRVAECWRSGYPCTLCLVRISSRRAGLPSRARFLFEWLKPENGVLLYSSFLSFSYFRRLYRSRILHLNNRISNTHNNTDTLGNVGGKSWRLVLHLVGGGFHWTSRCHVVDRRVCLWWSILRHARVCRWFRSNVFEMFRSVGRGRRCVVVAPAASSPRSPSRVVLSTSYVSWTLRVLAIPRYLRSAAKASIHHQKISPRRIKPRVVCGTLYPGISKKHDEAHFLDSPEERSSCRIGGGA